ncbi:MAG: hypothetical protein MK538_14180, partial [Planctomycetes bacterium]|nr:hypothetical protein [Planctomycetota bacterium]
MSASRLSCLKDEDREFFDRELSSFLPDRIFDAHTHLWRLEAMEWGPSEFRGDVGLPEYLDLM